MSLVALGLVLGAAVSHATWNLAAKRASGGGAAFVWVYSVVSTLVYLPLAVVFAQPLSLPAFAVILLSGSVHLGYFLLLQRGYAVGDLSVVYPLARGTGPLLSVIAAIVILGDRPTYVALAGAGLVVAGILVIGTGAAARGHQRDAPDPAHPVRAAPPYPRGRGVAGPSARGVRGRRTRSARLHPRAVRLHPRPGQSRRTRPGTVHRGRCPVRLVAAPRTPTAAPPLRRRRRRSRRDRPSPLLTVPFSVDLGD